MGVYSTLTLIVAIVLVLVQYYVNTYHARFKYFTLSLFCLIFSAYGLAISDTTSKGIFEMFIILSAVATAGTLILFIFGLIKDFSMVISKGRL